MIPSLDTYMYRELKTKLVIILSRPTIVDEALADFDKEARDNFKRTYCGVDPKREVQVSYVFPQTKETFDARFVVQLGQSEQVNTSLGAVEGTFTFRETGAKTELATVALDADSNRLYLEVDQAIGSYEGAENISFSEVDKMTIEGNRVFFRYAGNEGLIGLETYIYYTGKEVLAKDPKGIKKGYTSEDYIEVTPVSTNMDTARCLDAILKVILVTMLEDKEQKTSYMLQKASFGPMQNLIPEEEIDRVIFGRPLTLQYTVSNTVDFDFTKEINTIILKGVMSKNGNS